MCISCRPRVDVHEGVGDPAHVDACGQGRGSETWFFYGRHKWITPNVAGVENWKVDNQVNWSMIWWLGLTIVLEFIIRSEYTCINTTVFKQTNSIAQKRLATCCGSKVHRRRLAYVSSQSFYFVQAISIAPLQVRYYSIASEGLAQGPYVEPSSSSLSFLTNQTTKTRRTGSGRLLMQRPSHSHQLKMLVRGDGCWQLVADSGRCWQSDHFVQLLQTKHLQ